MRWQQKENENPRAEKSRRINEAKRGGKKKPSRMHALMGRKNQKRKRHAKTNRGQGR